MEHELIIMVFNKGKSLTSLEMDWYNNVPDFVSDEGDGIDRFTSCPNLMAVIREASQENIDGMYHVSLENDDCDSLSAKKVPYPSHLKFEYRDMDMNPLQMDVDCGK